ncbi:MAG: GGDEF domain-containing protein, partial [Sideroxyarcus sp.]|nr:GGDEF domain-containing protein [Sideroxyarcus sp.]
MLGIILVIGFLSIGIAAFIVSRDAIRAGIVQQALPLTADNIYSEIQKDLLRPVFVSSMMAQDTFMRDWLIGGERDVSRIRRYLNEVKTKYGTNTSFLVSESSRKYYFESGVLKVVSRGDPRDEWYFRVREMRAPYESNVDLDEANRDQRTVFVNYRVLDYRGNYIGAIGVGLTL